MIPTNEAFYMATDNSFDISAKVDFVEIKNAIEQANKEIEKRYDFKGSMSKIELNQKDEKIIVHTEDDYKLSAVKEILLTKMAARKVPIKALQFDNKQEASGQTIRQEINIQQGIPQEKAKEIVKFIKSLGFKKVQASIQQDIVRVSGKERDELQTIITEIKNHDFGIFTDFTNYR